MKGNCMNVLKKMLSSLNDGTKLSLLNEACVCLNAECVLYFLCERVKPDKDTSWWPLIKLCVNIKTDSVVLKIFLTFMNDEIKLDLLKNACIYGDEKCVTYLLCEGVKPDKGTSWMMWEMCMRKGNSGLNLLKKIFIYLNDEVKLEMLNSACKLGSEDFALYLLCAGVKPDKNTPLCVAEGGSVTLLIEIGLNDEIKSNVLSTACYSGSVECALYLLCEGVQPHKDTPWWSLITGGGRHVKADVDVLKKVLRYMTVEIKLNILNKTCDTGSKELALYLLREGVEPKKVTPLRSLITSDVNHGKGDVNVLKKVVQYLNDDIALDLLNKACDSGSEECALYLLSGNVKPDKHTPFCVAKGGSLNVLKKVLDNVNDDIKLPLLKIACRCASKECVIYLLSQGVKPDIDTPFTSLIYRDPLSKECLDLLKTIVIYLNDEMKLQLLNDACYHSGKCALYLLDEGVKPDKNTPFHAAKGGCLNLLKICVKGLKSDIKLAVLNEACSSGATDCVFYLLSEGVKPDQHTPWCSLFAKCNCYGKRDLDALVNILIYLNENMKMALLNTLCRSGSEECALYLLREGVTPNKDIDVWSLITGGVRWRCKGDVDILKKVVKFLNDEIKLDLLKEAFLSGSGECALYLLCEGVKLDKDILWRSLISRGIRCYVDIELLKNVVIYFDDEIKMDLLRKTCQSGSTECFFYLLRQGVEPDNTFPFWSLITRGREDVKGDVDILQKVVIYLNDMVKQDCLNKACRSGSVECALYLLCEGVQTDKDTDWWSLITRGRLYNVDMDLLKEVAIYLDDELKLGLLNKACRCGSEECALYFLRQGIKPDMDTDWWSLISRRMCP
ncbi:uncharacterized protein LOC117327078 [Pecten maximus]|uniref:uncharacterized protein LOC117327078 n=1 Tax=Pecten maximus TaxID=6579 RepID=UPI00145807A0|nr:uncharacterized protein LOC117327078 [Pecten maximus]